MGLEKGTRGKVMEADAHDVSRYSPYPLFEPHYRVIFHVDGSKHVITHNWILEENLELISTCANCNNEGNPRECMTCMHLPRDRYNFVEKIGE
jgi:hypothetical protein